MSEASNFSVTCFEYTYRTEVDPHVFDCVRRYTADYTIVSRR